NVSGVRKDSHNVKNVRKRHAIPVRYVGPALFALQHRDLAARRKALQLVKRKRRRARDNAVHGEPPVSESAGLKALECVVKWRDFVREWTLRNLAPGKLTR